MKLSILICHLESREESYLKLMNVLAPQVIRSKGVVEIITETDNGEMNIGQKRNALLKRAIGDYIHYVDDDDMVPDYFVEKILEAIETNPDVVGIRGHFIQGDNAPQIFEHSIKYKEWLTVDGVHQRCPNHLNPVRRELALQVMFPEKNFGEDMDYSLKLLPLLKTEVLIEDVMYYYLK